MDIPLNVTFDLYNMHIVFVYSTDFIISNVIMFKVWQLIFKSIFSDFQNIKSKHYLKIIYIPQDFLVFDQI